MREIKDRVGNFILLFLWLVVLLVGYSKYVKKDKLVRIGKYAILIVLTESMEPTIQEKELILIKKQKYYDLDDIVTYLDSYGNFITHRIVQLDEYTFMAKGDKNQIVDDSMELMTIQGKVIYHSKLVGNFVIYYLKPLIMIGMILCLISIFRKKDKGEIK